MFKDEEEVLFQRGQIFIIKSSDEVDINNGIIDKQFIINVEFKQNVYPNDVKDINIFAY